MGKRRQKDRAEIQIDTNTEINKMTTSSTVPRLLNSTLNPILILTLPKQRSKKCLDCAGSYTKSIMMKPIYQAARNQFSSPRYLVASNYNRLTA